MKGFMYILQCANNELYVGSTIDLDARLAAHHNGEGANFTYEHLPIQFLYKEEFPTIGDAFKREQQLKKWSRAKKEALIAGDIERLKMLAKNHTEHKKTGFRKTDWQDKRDNDSK